MTTNSAELKPCKCGQTSRWCGENECPELPLPSQACTAAQGEQSNTNGILCCENHPDEHFDLTVSGNHVTCIDCGDSWPIKAGSAALSAPERKVMTDAELPPLPVQQVELRARWKCDSCDGAGHTGEMRDMGHFQPPEPWPCPDCDGAGYVPCDAFTAEQMREYALAALNQQGEHTAPEGFVIAPREPTPGMITLFKRKYGPTFDEKAFRLDWAALIEVAAPSTAQKDGGME